ncbi:MAG: hypothetical protein ACOYLB_10640 [Phototrophicaceae bacterium]
MLPIVPIIPSHKILLTYEVSSDVGTAYYQYIISVFFPTLAELELYVTQAWHTAYGDYPARQIVIVCESLLPFQRAKASGKWGQLEDRLLDFVEQYSMKVVPYRQGFQF